MSHQKSKSKKPVVKKPDTGAALAAKSSSVSFAPVTQFSAHEKDKSK